MKARWLVIAIWLLGFSMPIIGTAFAESSCVLQGEDQSAPNAIEILGLLKSFPEIRSRLGKGLSVTLINEVISEDRHFSFGCQMLYDLWEESYIVMPVNNGTTDKQKAKAQKDLESLPSNCVKAETPWDLRAADEVMVITRLDPVSDEQLKKTTRWLAEHGVGTSTGSVFGRAAYAMVDLKQEKIAKCVCSLESGEARP